jgi:SAM-dependent methyltransferase
MKSRLLPGAGLPALACALVAATLLAQSPQEPKPYQPEVGQAGKDVVWVPTSDTLVQKMLDLAQVTSADYLIDLGSGDGRTVIAAARRGARAVGIEYNPDMVELARTRARDAGLSDRATFEKADLFEADFSRATVITMFLLPSINLKLRPKLLELRPGTRIVSNTFTMDDWEPDDTARVEDGGKCGSWCTALLWVVPAKVEGTWRTPAGSLALAQHFQVVSGTLAAGGNSADLSDGRLRGDELHFTAGGATYAGRVRPDAIEGTVTSGGRSTSWRATRGQ